MDDVRNGGWKAGRWMMGRKRKKQKKQYLAIGKDSTDNHIWVGYKMHKLAVEKGSIRLQYAVVSHPIIGAV